jgi:hypothetical protein
VTTPTEREAVPLTAERSLKADAAAIVARHVADETRGTHRGPLPDESITYICAECDNDWPCDTVLVGQIAATLVSPAEYNAVCDDRETWRRIAGEAQQEAADAERAARTSEGKPGVEDWRRDVPGPPDPPRRDYPEPMA